MESMRCASRLPAPATAPSAPPRRVWPSTSSSASSSAASFTRCPSPPDSDGVGHVYRILPDGSTDTTAAVASMKVRTAQASPVWRGASTTMPSGTALRPVTIGLITKQEQELLLCLELGHLPGLFPWQVPA